MERKDTGSCVAGAGGRFSEPRLTAEQMVEKGRSKMKEMHVPGFLAQRSARDLPALKRWMSK